MAVSNKFLKRLYEISIEFMRESVCYVKKFLSSDAHNYAFYFVILILLNVFSSTYNFRQDITSEGVYSLSQASKHSVSNLTEPLSVRVFFSDDLPAPYSNVRLYLQDLLQEYKSASDRNFSFEFVDMGSNEGKNIAQAYGIQPAQIQQRTGDEFKATSAYMGMVFIHGDLIDKMPQVVRMKGLEYSITTLINKMRSKVDILARDEMVTVTLYASDALKGFNINGLAELDSAMKEIVDSISKENSGKIEYSVVKDIDDATIESLISSHGVSPLAWESTRMRDGSYVPAGRGVLAVTMEYGEKSKAINLPVASSPFGMIITGVEDLDARIRGSIDSLISNNITIGYVASGSTKDARSAESDAGSFLQLLSDMYEIQMIDLNDGSVPTTVTTLIINGPIQPFSKKELYAVDNFIMRGGNVLFFVDMFHEIRPEGQNAAMQQPIFMPLETNVPSLLQSYGLTVNQDYVLDKNSFVMQQPGMDPVNLYFAPNLFEQNLDSESVVTRYLKHMLLLKTSSIEIDDSVHAANDIKSKILVSSSPESWLISGRIDLSPYNVEIPPVEQLQSYPLAVLLEGKFPSHFSNGKPDIEGELSSSITVEKHLSEAIAESKIAVISTSEITSGNLQDINNNDPRQRFVYNNALFLHNLVDYMNGLDDVPQMRSKGIESNLKEVSETSKNVFKIVNIMALPLLSIIIALLVLRLRITRRKKIERRFSGEAK